MTIRKLDLGTGDLLGKDLDKFAQIFPDLVTEKIDKTGRLRKAIDFDKFKARFSDDIIDEGKERYEFTWPGKRAAMAEANAPINKTLRPVMEESKNWDTTENLYIQGDNLEVLKLLQESYLGQIKIIYIDPPYNTGNDFVYKDDFKKNLGSYNEDSIDYDDEGSKLVKNTETNGRFHSDWCSMIYPRVKLARNLLKDDGIIFTSIDENELNNIIEIFNEVFGENNLDILIWRKNGKQGNTKKINRFKNTHEYIVVGYKNKDKTTLGKMKLIPKWESTSNPDNDPRGDWMSGNISNHETKSNTTSDNYYSVKLPSGRVITREWFISKEELEKLDNDILINEEGNRVSRIFYGLEGDNIPRLKRFENEEQEFYFDSIIDEMGTFTDAKEEIEEILGSKNIFDTPKPTKIIKELIRVSTNKNDIVFDYFSGSATTAHAAMDLNAEDGGSRKFIMVQLPEETKENSEAYKAGYKNICEIGKERIRRAGDKILADNKDKGEIENIDTGFRVLSVDSTNMNDVAIKPDNLQQTYLDEFESNIKADRTDLDLLFACLLAWGLPLDRKYESEDYKGFTIHTYNEGDLIACFSEEITEEAIKFIAMKNALRVVFRDSCFKSSQDKINLEEIFKIFSPETDIRVL